MEEAEGLYSNKKLWASLLACLIGTAILLSVSHEYPTDSIAYTVFRTFGMLTGLFGVGILVTSILTWHEEFELPISSSIWITINRAEQIELEKEIDCAMLEYIMRDVRDYERRLKIVYPRILENRIVVLEQKLRHARHRNRS